MVNNIFYSEVDSNRFNLTVYRANISDINVKEILELINTFNIDLLILRISVEKKEVHYLINEIGHKTIHADTLVYYYIELNNHIVKDLKNKLEFEIINEVNIHILDEIVPIIFNNYRNHYFSNPSLNKDKIKEGYIEWAKSFACQNVARISWLVKKDNEYIGFATCSYEVTKKECEGVLYGVHPAYSGSGIYTDIIRFTQNHFKKNNFHTMKVSTQIQNFAVQKAWVKEGFFLKKAFDTYHVNISK